jgi:hypothetical protein
MELNTIGIDLGKTIFHLVELTRSVTGIRFLEAD